MENAWMNSLSEDWVSQPRSDGSQANGLLTENATSPNPHRAPRNSSRIPLLRSRRQLRPNHSENNQWPLNERSPNENNIPASQRALSRPSKPEQDTMSTTPGLRGSRAASVSATGSIRHYTVHHKLLDASSKKSNLGQNTPEWKRRLLHGEVVYGEQRDLFSSAGLENIFRPPHISQVPVPFTAPDRLHTEDTILPSSPPQYEIGDKSQDKFPSTADMGEEDKAAASENLMSLNYKMMDMGSQQFSHDNFSQSGNFRQTVSGLERDLGEIQQTDFSDEISGQLRVASEDSTRIEAARVISGQSDVRHEDLSPIYISHHNMVDERINYSAVDLSTTDLQQRLENLAVNETLQSSISSGGSPQLLPGNELTETGEFAQIGKFVNLGRGGESENGSFQQRMLSPSSLQPADESAMICEASVEASTPKNSPSFSKAPRLDNSAMLSPKSVSQKVPRPQYLSPVMDESSNSRPGSGSPLKLFGIYDTFTNQKILRRVSQFENCMPEDSAGENVESSKLGKLEIESTNHAEINDAFLAPSSPSKYNPQTSQNVNRFGDGNLDHFEFSEGSLESSHGMLVATEESVTASPQIASSHAGFKFHLEPSSSLGTETTGQQRSRRINTTMKERITTTRRTMRLEHADLDAPSSPHIFHQLEILDTPRKRNGDSEGKRLLHSPPKNPTPKRRRTLHKADLSHVTLDGRISDPVMESHDRIQSVISKKRKDARHEDNQKTADPQVLAMRQILQPKLPTASQRINKDHRRSEILNSSGSDSERVRLEKKEKISRIQADLDATAPSGTPTAAGTGKSMYSDSRKGSVTTQDFLDEAKKIMAGIRGKARPGSGLASVEESESEYEKPFPIGQGTDQDDSYEESTKEPFSRPPSRNGGPLPRLPQRQQNPEILNHLKKYEEMSDEDGIIASSLKSIGPQEDSSNATGDVDRLTDYSNSKSRSEDSNLGPAYQSDPPNIRITEYPDLQRKRKHSSSSAPTCTISNHDAGFPSYGSNESSGPSTERSVPTGSSRGSDSKHIIAPHTVSHLIPEQLAGMTFDREKHIWIKNKAVSGGQDYNDILPSEDTDDDPFGDIPDLTVDETQELIRTKAAAARKPEEARIPEIGRYQNHLQAIHQILPDLPKPTKQALATRKADTTAFTELSNISRTASGTMAQLTRPTSRNDKSDEQAPPPSTIDHGRAFESHNTGREPVEDIEQEISIHESRIEHKIFTPRRRKVTISFSSPLASIIPLDEFNDGTRSDEKEVSDSDSISIYQGARRRSYSAQSRSIQHAEFRKQSLTKCNFLARPVSRIDEHDEESFLGLMEDDRSKRSVSIMMSTPLPVRASTGHVSIIPVSSVDRYTEGVLQLTPLPDFSVNQPDESFALEVSYIGQQQRQTSSNVGKRSLSLSVKELIQRITDIEPYEPFWEHIRKIELRSKQLQTLHMLNKFCSQLEELDVSENDIRQLDGAPETIRRLRIGRNCLSDLSSWAHLRNLQYVDISNNGLTSLEGFKNLVHLRNLRADNNKIHCLKGINELDGLISLRLRSNMIQRVDFAGSVLHSLTDLDLKGNRICEIYNLQELRSLTTLNLEDNDIHTFTRENREIMWSLKYLKLGGNKLEHVDITQYPNIRLLYLDRNRLGRVTGLLKAKHLDSLSLREQQPGFSLDQNFLNEALEVRKLFLSGNLLTTFRVSVDFLNLQYLELANCGLEALPIDFGQMTPNLRVLNLNFNAIRDIKPLLGIVRLKKLYLAGNRLARLRKTTNVLAQFSTLTRVDLRNNPLTLGFYPPPSEKRMVVHDGPDDERDGVVPTSPFTLPEGDKESDAAYAGRLDMETRMRRRVYEMLMLGGCARIKMLDELQVNRAGVAIKDNVWAELVKVGLVYESVDEAQGTDREPHTHESTAEEMEQDREAAETEHLRGHSKSDPVAEEAWQAEDSFA